MELAGTSLMIILRISSAFEAMAALSFSEADRALGNSGNVSGAGGGGSGRARMARSASSIFEFVSLQANSHQALSSDQGVLFRARSLNAFSMVKREVFRASVSNTAILRQFVISWAFLNTADVGKSKSRRTLHINTFSFNEFLTGVAGDFSANSINQAKAVVAFVSMAFSVDIFLV